MKYPDALEELMETLKALPGVGRRSSERMALSMLGWELGRLERLSETLRTLKMRVAPCRECGNFASDEGLCAVCASPVRDSGQICVVEEAPQIRSIESSGAYRGLYHVLGGRIAPLEGKGVDAITLDALLRRIDGGGIREVVLALSPDVEGQATAVYIGNILKGRSVRVSRLAQGLPAGSDLSYADPATIAAALGGRVQVH